jgi:chromosome partitioning protein
MKRLLSFSGKGGCGKTHLSRHLAVAAALSGMKVVTVDVDPQRGLSHWRVRRPDSAVQIDNLEARWTDSGEIVEFSGNYDLMIIDTPAYQGENDQPEHLRALINTADVILIPCRPTIDDADSAVPMMRFIMRTGKDVSAAFVLNAVKPREGITDIERMMTKVGEICPIRIFDRADYRRAAKQGLTVLDITRTKKNDQAHEEMLGVWDFAARKMGLEHGT